MDDKAEAGVHLPEATAHPATMCPALSAGRGAPFTTPGSQFEYQEPLCLPGKHITKLVSLGETSHLRGDLLLDEGS